MAKRSRSKRDTVNAPNATMYAKREDTGEFAEMDEKGRSQKTDRRRKAKKRVRSGFGDQGDRATSRGTGASGAKRSTKNRRVKAKARKGSTTSRRAGSAKRATAKSRRGGSARKKR